MIEPQRLLARMNTITINWENNIPASGDVLTAEDIAGSLAGLEQGPYLLMRYLWCQDGTVRDELYGLLLLEIIHLADKENWGCKNNFSKLMMLIKAGLNELGKVNLCKPCRGTGLLKTEICMQCNGMGVKKRTQAQLAHSCGVKPANWNHHWALRYNEVYLLLVDWNENGLKHLRSRL